MSEDGNAVLLLRRLEELRVDLQNLVRKRGPRVTMNNSSGLMLQEASVETKNRECFHAELREKRSINGVTTGAYVCSMCGALMLVSASEPEAH
jgi:hypothetical protein